MELDQSPGVGKYQSELAEIIKYNQLVVSKAALYSAKRRDISAAPLAVGLHSIGALTYSIQVIIKCLTTHEDREDFAKSLIEKLGKR